MSLHIQAFKNFRSEHVENLQDLAQETANDEKKILIKPEYNTVVGIPI